MLQEDKMIFPYDPSEYLVKMIEFITTRFVNINYKEHLKVDSTFVNGKTRIDCIYVNIQTQKFSSEPTSEYSINIKEKILPSDNLSCTYKFKYEIKNDNDITDIVRFDFFNYDDYPSLHINADEEIWGNHLTYNETTNLNLENLDSFKAMSIFEKFMHHPESHILDKKNNKMYVSIIG